MADSQVDAVLCHVEHLALVAVVAQVPGGRGGQAVPAHDADIVVVGVETQVVSVVGKVKGLNSRGDALLAKGGAVSVLTVGTTRTGSCQKAGERLGATYISENALLYAKLWVFFRVTKGRLRILLYG